jgi:hypothetical protein
VQAIGNLFMEDLTHALQLLFANDHLSLEHYATLMDMADSHGKEVASAWVTAYNTLEQDQTVNAAATASQATASPICA